jgi:putative lipoic acid-binding regulatory protein
MSEDKTTLIEFPSAFPIKIMGEARDGFAQAIVEIVLRHAPDYDATGIGMRPSSTGRYLGLTCTITATSQEQLDALYRELSGHPLVKVVL